jgi:hypothetical protein
MFLSLEDMKKVYDDAVENGTSPRQFWAGAMATCIRSITNGGELNIASMRKVALCLVLADYAAMKYEQELLSEKRTL